MRSACVAAPIAVTDGWRGRRGGYVRAGGHPYGAIVNIRSASFSVPAAPRAHAARVERQDEEVRQAIGGQVAAAALFPDLQQQSSRRIELTATRKQES
jgi:hypothetical protein